MAIIITTIIIKRLVFIIIIVIKAQKIIFCSKNFIVNLLVINNSMHIEGIVKDITKGTVIAIFMAFKKIITF